MLSLLTVLVADPDDERWGLQLAKSAGIRSPTVYRALARLELAGWVTSAAEPIDPKAQGRPRRRMYRLTPGGLDEAKRLVLAKREHQTPTPTRSSAHPSHGPHGATA
jgi:PadR family transcriptional regulator, regulatory protein PadR